ncbi:MAG: twin-arginine translocase subunit TatC [Bacteroidaceae bacterium]|nr:twin-arginine translocase subunit TatC [Bacteroidaceae bacterium]
MTFWDHLEELRRVLLRCTVVVAVFAILAFIFKDEVFFVVFAPKSSDFLPALFGTSPTIQLINTELTRQFIVHMMTSLYVGVIVAAPYIIYELYRFISPGLYENERHYSMPVVIASYVMFMLGLLFSYFILFPITFRFLAGYQVDAQVENLISLESYIDTLVFLSLAMGIIFEIPILSWLLGRLGILHREDMQQYRRHAIVAILVIAAIITPTSDVITLSIVSLPMYLLYELSILLVPSNHRSL